MTGWSKMREQNKRLERIEEWKIRLKNYLGAKKGWERFFLMNVDFFITITSQWVVLTSIHVKELFSFHSNDKVWNVEQNLNCGKNCLKTFAAVSIANPYYPFPNRDREALLPTDTASQRDINPTLTTFRIFCLFNFELLKALPTLQCPIWGQ